MGLQSNSIEAILASSATIADKVDALTKAAVLLQAQDLDRAIRYAEEACRLAEAPEQARSLAGLVTGQLTLGELYLKRSTSPSAQPTDLETSIEQLQRALPAAEKIEPDNSKRACLRLLTQAYRQANNFEQALNYLEQLYAIAIADQAEKHRAEVEALESKYKLEISMNKLVSELNASLEQEITVRKRIKKALEQRSQELALINQASQLLSSTLDLSKILELVLSGMHNLLNITATSFWLRLPDSNALVCRHAIGVGSETVIGWQLAEGQGLAGQAAKTGETILVTDAATDKRHFKQVDEMVGVRFRSILSIPLRSKRGVVGVLNLVDTEVGRFKHEELALVEPIAAAAAIAIENAQLYTSAQEEIAQRSKMEQMLRQQNLELDAFAHTVAHNLKNPLSTIVGYADFLQVDLATMSQEEIAEALEIIKSGGHKAVNIINELLLLAGVRKAQVDMEPLEMGLIVKQALERLRLLIKSSQAEIILPKSWPASLGYAPWIEEVWTNYLSNGLKYGGIPPKLEFGATVQGGGMNCFWLKDNGPGLSLEAQNDLFVEFHRLNKVEGTGHGLGLSIVKRIIEKLDGQVGVESQPGQGSKFYFTLPGAD